MSKSIRFSTLLAKHGPVKTAVKCTQDEWQLAVKENRFCTVYHSENDHCTPIEALVSHHGCVNTICKLVFTKPLPATINRIIGMRNNQEAFDLCND
jgi:hypothetical protein